jgi:hypothetical protein
MIRRSVSSVEQIRIADTGNFSQRGWPGLYSTGNEDVSDGIPKVDCGLGVLVTWLKYTKEGPYKIVREPARVLPVHCRRRAQ